MNVMMATTMKNLFLERILNDIIHENTKPESTAAPAMIKNSETVTGVEYIESNIMSIPFDKYFNDGVYLLLISCCL